MIRELNIVKEQIKLYRLNLNDLVVVTECANGYYAYNLLVPILAGAKKVIALTKTTQFSSAKDNINNFYTIAKELNINTSVLSVVRDLKEEHLKQADILTNSGMIRPITGKMISAMKNTAVIPLMWESWEFRDSELDLKKAILKDIVVLGTNEDYKKLKLYPTIGILAISLLLKLNLEVYKTKVIVFSSGILQKAISKTFIKNGVQFVSITNDRIYINGKSCSNSLDIRRYIKTYDAIIFAELNTKESLCNKKNILNFDEIRKINPEIKIGIIAGNIDEKALKKSNLVYYPKKIAPPGYMSYQPYHIGPRPVIELFSCSLKVGEVVSRCRLSGMNLEESINYAIKHSAAMDFDGKTYIDMHRELKHEI